jgi:hypothetical protein
MEIKGRSLIEGIPKAITVDDSEIREALSECVSTIVSGIRVALERNPPELSADISDRGIVLAGGGALLKNLDKRVREEAGLPVALPPFSSLGSIPLRADGPGTLYHGLRQLFQLLQRGVVDVILFSRGFGHARRIHFLFDPREKRLVGFLSWLVLMHTCTMPRVQEHYRSIGNRADSFGIVFPAEQF